MTIDMSQFYQVFFEESAEHLAAMEGLLLDLDVDNPDPEQLNAIFRAAHSIKGSAGTFGFTDLAETTHILENLLDRIRKSELSLNAEMVDAFLACGDKLSEMLEAHQGRGSVDPASVEEICACLRQLSDGGGGEQRSKTSVERPGVSAQTPAGAAKRTYVIQFVPTVASAQGEGLANLQEDLAALGALQVLKQPESASNGVGLWELQLSTDALPEVFSEQIDFIAESGAWRVLEAGSPKLSEPLKGQQEDDAGAAYGFFEPLEAASPPQSEHDDAGGAYGFFEPLDQSADGPSQGAPSLKDDGVGYGFFEPLTPEVQLAPQQELGVATQNVVEEGDGFGFFVPIEPPTQKDVTEAPVAPVQPPVRSSTPALAAEPEADKPAMLSSKEGSGQKAARTSTAHASGADSSIRVSIEKVDQLINLVGELVITQAMLLQTATQMQESAPERLLNGLAQLERNTRDLQESVMSIRMMPISFVFSRFPRVVRDLSSKLGKQVELKTSGETTELDKSLIERIADPLTHLIRNSLDHGIESPERRLEAGKSPVGTITLKAYHQGGNIVIEVGDDGAGLNRNKILAKARERGLPVSDQMTDPEVFGLIFEAGFSTAEQVTDVSGRGVGMDVVRRNIQSMGGRVEIDSMSGIGTRMTVRLPLTLAILDGMSIAVGDQTYILPLSYVVESFQPRDGDTKTLANQARVIQVRGEYLPVLVLHELFNLKSRWSDFTQGIMVVIDADGTKAALFVDALLGQHQVVIKSLEANYRRVQGISGATIMGDGHVALILDVSAIAGMAKSNMQKAE